MTHQEFVAWMNGFLNGRCPWRWGPNGERRDEEVKRIGKHR